MGVLACAPPTKAQIEAIRALFEAWGREGGQTRTRKLTPEARREIARRAAQARWSRRDVSALFIRQSQ